MRNEFDEQIEALERRLRELEMDLEQPCEFHSNPLIDALHRFCRRAYVNTPDQYKWNTSISVQEIADIFGWTDMDFSRKEE